MKDRITITIEEDIVRIGRSTSSQPQSAVVLSRVVERGRESIYLDRRIHRSDETDSAGEWTLGGAFTTVLSRPVSQ